MAGSTQLGQLHPASWEMLADDAMYVNSLEDWRPRRPAVERAIGVLCSAETRAAR